jgi:cobalt-precorrin-5B (C1)-methyltransferase
VRAHYHLPLEAMLDMGDFAGGVLKYLRSHPVARLTIAGGFGKMCKLAQGHLDLHSSRSQVDFAWLSGLAECPHQAAVKSANTALEALTIAGNGLADQIAGLALNEVRQIVADAGVTADVMVVSREGKIIAHAH